MIGRILVVGFVASLVLPCSAGEEFLWYVDGGEVVITNTPCRPDVRPVPGFGARVVSLAGKRMPATPWDPFIRRVAEESEIDPALVKAVAIVESGLDPGAISPKGARGLMQLMPATAERYGVSDPHDPYQSLRAGARHLRDLLDEFDGDVTLALAAYNAGSGAVRRWGGVPGYRETRNYVRKVEGRLRDGAGGSRDPRRGVPASTPVRLVDNPDGSVSLVN